MEVITMYASIRNIMSKSDEELRELRDARINDLWIGVETGHEDVLRHMNKGYTLRDTYEQLGRLNEAGIRHNTILMLGAAGKGRGLENAAATAKLINTTQPQLVGVTSLGFFDGSELSKEVEKENFLPATELEILEEERKLIELIAVGNMPFYGDHPTNASRLVGVLPRDREHLIGAINSSIKASDTAFLHGSAKRSTL